MRCPWCLWEGEVQNFADHLKVCPKNPMKEAKKQKPIDWNKPGATAKLLERYGSKENIEFESIISEQIDDMGNICFPLAKSPAKQYEACNLLHDDAEPPCIAYVLLDLIVAERVARRQYREVLQIMEVTTYNTEISHIQNEEYEHEQTLTGILSKLGYHIVEPDASKGAFGLTIKKI